MASVSDNAGTRVTSPRRLFYASVLCENWQIKKIKSTCIDYVLQYHNCKSFKNEQISTDEHCVMRCQMYAEHFPVFRCCRCLLDDGNCFLQPSHSKWRSCIWNWTCSRMWLIFTASLSQTLHLKHCTPNWVFVKYSPKIEFSSCLDVSFPWYTIV